MTNIALALAFVLSSLLSPGGRVLRMIIDEPVLQSLPPHEGYLLLAFANYWIPAVLVYALFRLTKAFDWLRPCKAIHVLFGLANVLIVLYVTVRIFASTVQGGGASFAVMSFAPFIIFPAWAMLAIGLVWLVTRSIRNHSEPIHTESHAIGFSERIALILILVIPVGVVVSALYLTDNAPLKLANEAEELFLERCKEAGERIIEAPQNVQSVYLDRDGGQYFNNIVNGVYGGHGGSILGKHSPIP